MVTWDVDRQLSHICDTYYILVLIRLNTLHIFYRLEIEPLADSIAWFSEYLIDFIQIAYKSLNDSFFELHKIVIV